MRILVFNIGAIGDTVVSIPAFRALRRYAGPTGELHILQQGLSEKRVMPQDILAPLGLIDGAMVYKPFSEGGIIRSAIDLRRRVRAGRFEAAAFVMPVNRPDKAILRDRIFFRLAGIKRLIGFHPFPVRNYTDPKKQWPREAELRLKRLEADGVSIDYEADMRLPLIVPPAADLTVADDWLRAKRKHPEWPLMVIAFSSNQPATRWPLENFATLGPRLMEKHQIEVVAIGGKVDLELSQGVLDQWGCGLNACGEFSIMQSAALISRSKLFLGLDTGTMHTAYAVGVKVVSLFSDHNHPGQWDPIGEGHTIIHNPVPCGGCNSPVCVVEGHPCMTGITVERVLNEMDRALAANVRR